MTENNPNLWEELAKVIDERAVAYVADPKPETYRPFMEAYKTGVLLMDMLNREHPDTPNISAALELHGERLLADPNHWGPKREKRNP